MKKTHLLLLVMVIAGLILTPSFASAKTVFKLGFGDPIDSDQGAFAKQFKYLMEGYTNGEVEIQLFPGSSLGTETEMLQNTRRGALDMSMVAVTNMTPFSKELQLLTMPYVIQSMRDAVNI
ncbi:MAG TPA: C4-dicarboxylate ABC transporter substrate-binding protein, partial [Desulfobacteraceae bacterium]|nr:C4-dicarboxylate ABC transporter substrate-binding protein [Desulfobacteraceae bacterium]